MNSINPFEYQNRIINKMQEINSISKDNIIEIINYRDLFMYHQVPGLKPMLYIIGVAALFYFIGLFIFRKLEKGFAEEV